MPRSCSSKTSGLGATRADRGNAHLLSTSAWLQGLEEIGAIPSAAAIRRKILRGRPNFKVEFIADYPASKIAQGTEWRSKFRES